MRQFTIWLISLVWIASFCLASPVLADKIAKKSPDYPVVIENLEQLLALQGDPSQTEYSPEELQQEIEAVKLQKYVLETSEDWGVCRNQTGKILGIYGHAPKKSSQDTLVYLADGEETDDSWDCEGIYLPNDIQVASLNLTAGEPSTVKILDGTHLVVTTNPTTGELEFNLPSALLEVVPITDNNWPVPNLAQGDIDAQVPNAPID
ncbi:conserved hypothetical protein [Rippkaea orientalis PCC 8801]|uniref:Secreted protein n=1 Tax=Rippkaea orientalis (strain PCC 8801 / RF-1) TaxID=41431 RepID=B7JWI4_RIPO1|nr:hypothetical protein [Rippkaea orientalis]ACK68325.1 conserved hypothetical protein [Rippkaea orientalis PCC 8801]